MRNRYFLMKNVLAHKTSKRTCKSIPQKHNKNNGKVKEIQRASILEPQNKQREPATQISIILILTQAKQHFSIQLGVRKWHRKALRNALPISQNSYKINVNHLKWKLEPRKCYDHLCAERSPLMPDSLRISSYSRKLCWMQIRQGRPIKEITALSKIGLGELCANNDSFYNGFFLLLMRRRCGA